MPIRTAKALGASLIAGTLSALACWVAASVVIGAALAVAAYYLAAQVWPSAALPAGVSVFLGFPTIMLPIAWSNALRRGVSRAMRESGLSRTIADVLLSTVARALPGDQASVDLGGLDGRIHEVVHNALPVRPLWFRGALAGVIARRVSREMLGRLRDDLTAATGAEPEVLRDRVATSIETLTGDWAARKRAA